MTFQHKKNLILAKFNISVKKTVSTVPVLIKNKRLSVQVKELIKLFQDVGTKARPQ